MRTFILDSSHITRINTFLEENWDICLQEHEVKIQGVNG
jgi:hypothetical protein